MNPEPLDLEEQMSKELFERLDEIIKLLKIDIIITKYTLDFLADNDLETLVKDIKDEILKKKR